MIYVCSSVSWVGFLAKRTPFVRPGQNYTGVGGAAGVAWPEGTGTFTAIDATSGKTVWQKTFPEPCYSGTATTAGNLVFVGRNAGELQAYNATTGARLWSFQTGAGANNTADDLPAERQAVHRLPRRRQLARRDPARRQPLALRASTARSAPPPHPARAQAPQHEGEGGKTTTTTTAAGNAAAGATVFADNCVSCHGAPGTAATAAPT